MEQAFSIAAVWLALAVFSAVVASHLRISVALVEICVGMVAVVAADKLFYPNALGANLDWLRFIASAGAVLLTFLAGAELDPTAMKAKLTEVTVVGLFGFFAPFWVVRPWPDSSWVGAFRQAGLPASPSPPRQWRSSTR